MDYSRDPRQFLYEVLDLSMVDYMCIISFYEFEDRPVYLQAQAQTGLKTQQQPLKASSSVPRARPCKIPVIN